MESPWRKRGIWRSRKADGKSNSTDGPDKQASMENPRLIRGIWWSQNPDGSWKRWESPTGPWVEASTPPPRPFPSEDVQALESWSVKNYATADLELFKSAVEQLRFVTTMFWQQAGFFFLIQGALLTVVSRLLPIEKGDLESLRALSVLGLLIALFWGWVAWNRVWIIEQWRDQVRKLDKEVDRHLVYDRVESLLDEHPLRRPASATKFLPWLLALGWIVLLIWSLASNS